MWRSAAIAAAILLLEGTADLALGGTPAYQPRWLLDAQARCYVLYTGSDSADSVMWSGGCADRRAEGPGTATFLQRGRLVQAISGTFAEGMPIGQAQIVWADGRHSGGAAASARSDNQPASAAEAGRSPQRVAQVVSDAAVPVRPSAFPTASNAANPAPGQIGLGAAPAAVRDNATAQAAAPAPSVPATWLDTFKGRKLIAVDGTAISISASGDSIALATPPGTPAASGYLSFLNGTQGTVSSDADGDDVRGLFRLGDASLTIDYATGASAILSRTSDGGVTIANLSGPASACSIWYPEGHVFSAAEREAAVAAYASRLGVRAGFAVSASCGSSPSLQADSTSQKGSASAHAARSHRISAAKTAMSRALPEISATPVVVRASDVHPIDGAFSVPVPQTQTAQATETVEKVVAPATPSQCLSVEAEGANVGFRNHCGFEVQFAWCVVDAADPVRLCGSGSEVGGVGANGFGPLFAERSPNAMEHEFRWIACGGARKEVVPKLVRTEPPAGQCVRARAS